MTSEFFVTSVAQLATVVAVLAFITSIVTQVTKELPLLKAIPTNLQVIVTAMILSVLAVITYCQLKGIAMTWYIVVGSVLGGFFVAFVALFGWEEVTMLWERFKK